MIDGILRIVLLSDRITFWNKLWFYSRC